MMSGKKLSDILTPKQQEAWKVLNDDSTKEILYGGAAGGGKSFIGSLWLHFNCILYPGTRWIMARSELKTLKRTTLATFFDVGSMFNYNTLYEHKEQKGLIQYGNGSQIILYDLKHYPGKDPNFDGLGSLEITGAFVDEANQIISKAKDVLRSRIRYRLDEFNLIPKVLFSCNPAKNWVYQDFYKPYRNGKLSKDKAFIQALVKDNPHISKHYVANLRSMKDKNLRARLLEGDWEYDNDPNSLIEYDAILDAFENEHVKVDKPNKYITADIAMRGSDKFVMIAWYGWVAVDKLILEKTGGKDVIEAIEKFRVKHQVRPSNITYDADGVGSFVGGKGGFIKRAIPFVNGSRPLKYKGKDEKYEHLKAQCYYHLSDKINKGELWLRCFDGEDKTALIAELEQVKSRDIDNDKVMRLIKKEDVKAILGRSPDLSDALMMRIRFDLGNKLPAML